MSQKQMSAAWRLIAGAAAARCFGGSRTGVEPGSPAYSRGRSGSDSFVCPSRDGGGGGGAETCLSDSNVPLLLLLATGATSSATEAAVQRGTAGGDLLIRA